MMFKMYGCEYRFNSFVIIYLLLHRRIRFGKLDSTYRTIFTLLNMLPRDLPVHSKSFDDENPRAW